MFARIEDTISPFCEFFGYGRTCLTGATTIPSSWMVIDHRERSLRTLGVKVDRNGRSGGRRAGSDRIRRQIEGSIDPGSGPPRVNRDAASLLPDPDTRRDRTLVD